MDIDTEKISNILQHYTVGLISNDFHNKEKKHIGSGVLSCFDNNFFIITAMHVIDEIDGNTDLYLCISQKANNYKIEYAANRVKRNHDAYSEEFGPDCVIIPLFPIEVEPIRQEMSFYNFENSINKAGNNISSYWVLAGTPSEDTKLSLNEAGFKIVNALESYCLFLDREPKYYENDKGYDYADAIIPFNPDQSPSDFGGMSGGGLWQVNPKSNGNFDYKFCGTIFYRTPVDGSTRIIRCQGIKYISDLVHQAYNTN